jgi:hypothetical protein
MRPAEKSVQFPQVLRQSVLAPSLLNIPRALQLQLVEAVINRVDFLSLHLFRDGAKGDE